MSSGRDIYLENINHKYDQVTNGETQHQITFYARVNAGGMTHGAMKQIDDNIKVVYDTVNHRIVELSII
jgi:hypothetical protein